MKYKLSKLQTWTLFMLYESGSTANHRTIIMNCCRSAIKDLDPDTVRPDLKELETLGYIIWIGGKGYSITDRGMVHVRKVIIRMEDASKSGSIPQDIIDKQEDGLKGSLEGGNFDATMFVNAVLSNVGRVMELIVFVLELI